MEVRPVASGEIEGASADGESVGGITYRLDVPAQGDGLFVFWGVLINGT